MTKRIGDLVIEAAHLADEQGLKPAAVVLSDEQWIRAKAEYYASAGDLMTPDGRTIAGMAVLLKHGVVGPMLVTQAVATELTVSRTCRRV